MDADELFMEVIHTRPRVRAAMALEQLEGRQTSRGRLHVAATRPGRFPEEQDVLLSVGAEGSRVATAKCFAGRPAAGVPPWIEAILPRDDEGFATELVAALAGVLPPAGRLMLVYGDDETERLLRHGVPAAATPLGHALFGAGCTWFKDWYFAEGGREGEAKLQGNKPAHRDEAEAELERLREELRGWLGRIPDKPDELLAGARERAESILRARLAPGASVPRENRAEKGGRAT